VGIAIQQAFASHAIKKFVRINRFLLPFADADCFQNLLFQVLQHAMLLNDVLPTFIRQVNRVAVSVLNDFFHPSLSFEVLLKK
jgi:hypothetical protein